MSLDGPMLSLLHIEQEIDQAGEVVDRNFTIAIHICIWQSFAIKVNHNQWRSSRAACDIENRMMCPAGHGIVADAHCAGVNN